MEITVLACTTDFKGSFEDYDTTEAEIYFLRKYVQPALERLGVKMAIDSRQSIDQLVSLMTTQFNL